MMQKYSVKMRPWRKLAVGVAALAIMVPATPLLAADPPPQDKIVFNSQGSSREKAKIPPAVFMHSTHESRKCNECHPDIFVPKIGANKVTMKQNINGEFCGACHNGYDVWSMEKCFNCHKK